MYLFNAAAVAVAAAADNDVIPPETMEVVVGHLFTGDLVSLLARLPQEQVSNQETAAEAKWR